MNERGQCQVLHGTFYWLLGRLKALQIWYTNIHKSVLKSFIKLWSVCSANCFHLKWKWYYWLICNGIHFHYRWNRYMLFQKVLRFPVFFYQKEILWHPVVNISVHFDIKMRFIGESVIVEWFAIKSKSVQCNRLVWVILNHK